MSHVTEIFGSLVFNDNVMRERLPRETYTKLLLAKSEGTPLDPDVAGVVANAMKDWAIEKGATHFTHWFQPMTGITAEKHDSFLSRPEDGRVIMEFSGKELVKGEPDASSLPSGGLRATFEARGYTAWDPTSYAFIKEKTLCIPTVFCAYNGAALDKKTPLLKSLRALNEQCLRILRLFGNKDVKRVYVTVGAEQEYFLVDKSVFDKRKDLIYTGRTLFGMPAPKGQQLDDHYFGSIKPRVKAYMEDLNEELWKLGVHAKTEHNETAPAQHELAPIYTHANTASDHNQIVMDTMKKVAGRHDMVCLLHEKPFAGINGSGKHNNWGLETDTGVNLLKPGQSPRDNAQFLLFLCAVIKAVDEHQDLLRISVSTAGNDARIGGNEAPPSIVSMFLGDELTEVLESVESGTHYDGHKKVNVEVGVNLLPSFPSDNSDRNRTSPFAFTGNKFEFRMPGSSLSISGPNTVINTIVADTLREFADKLEKSTSFTKALNRLLRNTIHDHKRIIFNGNGYTEDWRREAKKRGLQSYATSVDAIPHLLDKANIDLFARNGIYSMEEMNARYDIILENYIKTVSIEAETMCDMAGKDIIPGITESISAFANEVAHLDKADTKLADRARKVDTPIISELIDCKSIIYEARAELLTKLAAADKLTDTLKKARIYADDILAIMNRMREAADRAEAIMGREFYPLPTYGDIIFSVR